MHWHHTAVLTALHILRMLPLAALPVMAGAQPGPGTNPFGDPVLQLTQAIPQCMPIVGVPARHARGDPGKADKEALEQLVRSLDDVEAVINALELVPRKP